jgi:glycine/D-amino acid oxidase-like deaminating enzyme
MIKEETDLLVVGAGIIGLFCSTRYKQENPQSKIICLESRSTSGLEASSGPSRIFRQNHLDKNAIQKAKQAKILWQKQEKYFDQELIDFAGHIFSSSNLQQSVKIFDQLDLPLDVLDSNQAQKKLPFYTPVADQYGFDPGSGIIDSQRTIRTLSKFTEDNFRFNQPVQEIRADKDYFIVRAGEQEFKTKKLIICAGLSSVRFANQIGISLPDIKATYHLRPIFDFKQSAYLDEKFPALSEANLNCYGLPAGKGYALGRGLSIGHVNNIAESSDLVSPLESFVEGNFPGLKHRARLNEPCQSLALGNENSDGYQIASSGSAVAMVGGNLFKFAPLIAEELLEQVQAI